ncbi:unnamed protein product [Acanthoscelides obtectus]|uniref:Nuclease HARBI1 n=1 Tax=Acanthoscelides obtectus TaxID=200917 RepID=A0A9P0KED1_ACAOB|nr:unnamed protein product [Acanthoscelides obtectus]CAK1633507.1 Putative nuclease HARBI1 [Acanthoscelides obtectus]
MEAALNLLLEGSDDEKDMELPARRLRFIRERIDHLEDLDDVDFCRRFRLSKNSALQVLTLIEHRLEFPTFEKNDAVSPMNQLLLCLRFYATGCTQLTAADFSGVSDTTAHRIIHRVTAAIASLYRQFIYFPRTKAEIQQTQRDFYVIARFPKRGGDPLPPDDNELQLPVPWDALIDQGRIDNPLIPNEHGHGADPYRQPLINDYFRTLHRNQNN